MRCENFGDVTDFHLDPGIFLTDSLSLQDGGNELLGGGLHSPSAFLV